MKVPLQVSFHGVPGSPRIEELVRERAQRLERVCDHLSSCRVTIEKPHRSRGNAEHWQVRIDLTVPPSHELVVRREASQQTTRDGLYGVVIEAFDAARRRLEKLSARQRGHVKAHPRQEVSGLVRRLFEDHGFLRTLDGRDVYFHRNAVVSDRFEELGIGMGVAFEEDEGEEGPQATSVRIIDSRTMPLPSGREL
ncbi:MAG: HPF/RaiA family ribosome-associated protein [Planctomycetes bacterium]|nr:HPF/RaiA family ribosome-associated protein [Planctomycetota bacterium]